jgi:hypothetical protein
LLKGGYAFELRYRPKARTTKDIDLSIAGEEGRSLRSRLDAARDDLQRAAELDLGDHLQFIVGEQRGEVHGAPHGGGTFPVEARIAGKPYGHFAIDVSFGDAVSGEPELLTGDDLLAFVGLAPARVVAISKAQQFAEKAHAYTLSFGDRENTRVKDLVDLLLLVDRGKLDQNEVVLALRRTFAVRDKQGLPAELRSPPSSWVAEFRSLADEADIQPTELLAAFERLAAFWRQILSGRQ